MSERSTELPQVVVRVALVPCGCLLALVLLYSSHAAMAAEPPAPGRKVDLERLRARLPEGVLRWGGDVEGGAPYQLLDPDNPRRVIGFEVDLANSLATIMSRQCGFEIRAEFVQYSWDTLYPGLVNRDFDVIISGYEMTEERRRQVRFTRPYYVYSQQLVVRENEDHIRSLDDCLDKSVGTLAGTAAERLLEQRGVARIVGFEGQVEPYVDLELGRVDAVLLDWPIAIFYASTNPKLKFVGENIGQGTYGIGLRPDDENLAAALDNALDELIASGELLKILRRWHIWNPSQAALALAPARSDELAALGFDANGSPVQPPPSPPADAVDINIVARSAESWTIWHYTPLLVEAAGTTIYLSIASMLVAVAIGLVVCVLHLYGPRPLQWLAIAYVEFFRGVPLLLLLFSLYFGLPTFGLELEAVWTAILGFGLAFGAYEAEVYRSAISSVPRGQWEAARALGMSEPLAFRRIILPQALQTALGPMTNDFVALFKDTSLVSVIAVRELTKEYLVLSRSSLKFVELGLLTALLYLAMSIPLGYLSRYFERRWGVPK
ncbi:MAG: ABC transporter permease subunit [Pirellulales bacterium]|nr:ABC transporter permease subunit [Pirellulales bacterium]